MRIEIQRRQELNNKMQKRIDKLKSTKSTKSTKVKLQVKIQCIDKLHILLCKFYTQETKTFFIRFGHEKFKKKTFKFTTKF